MGDAFKDSQNLNATARYRIGHDQKVRIKKEMVNNVEEMHWAFKIVDREY